jgi:hypothetical protein
MGGGSSLLSGSGDAWKGAKKLLKPGESEERFKFSLDPGGLFNTSKDEDIAAWQAKGDIMGIGAKATVSTREQEKRYNKEISEAKKAADKEARLVEAQSGIEEERKRRQDKRRMQRIERGSLLYGMTDGMGDKLGG